MAKKQTRRSISVKGITYKRLKAYCDAHKKSVSGYLEEIIADKLDAVGPPVPAPPVPPPPPEPPLPKPEPVVADPPSTLQPPEPKAGAAKFDDDFNDVFGGRVVGTGRTTGDHNSWE